MVGKELLGLLEKRKFPVGKFYPFNSGKRSAEVVFNGGKYACMAPSADALSKAELVFFVSTDEVSEMYARELASRGVWCIDDSSTFRLSGDVPLVIPEVNGGALSPDKKLIAGPNCTLTGAAVALAGVHRKYKITELRMASYQAVSGAGRDAMNQLINELKEFAASGKFPSDPGLFPRPMAFNLFPQVGKFDVNGNCGEENKVCAELKKIWASPEVKISPLTVRVPVLRGHSLGLWVKTAEEWTLEELRDVLNSTDGLKFYEKAEDYPCPLLNGQRTDTVYAGRLRQSAADPKEFQLWVVSDNLYKGAALNSVQIAEKLLSDGYL